MPDRTHAPDCERPRRGFCTCRPAPTPEVEAGERETCPGCGGEPHDPNLLGLCATAAFAPSQSPQGSELGDGAVEALTDFFAAHRVYTGVCRCGARIPQDYLASSTLTNEWVWGHWSTALVAAGYVSPEQAREREAAEYRRGYRHGFDHRNDLVAPFAIQQARESEPYRANRSEGGGE